MPWTSRKLSPMYLKISTASYSWTAILKMSSFTTMAYRQSMKDLPRLIKSSLIWLQSLRPRKTRDALNTVLITMKLKLMVSALLLVVEFNRSTIRATVYAAVVSLHSMAAYILIMPQSNVQLHAQIALLITLFATISLQRGRLQKNHVLMPSI